MGVGRVAARFLPRRAGVPLLGWRWRVLEAPDGSRHRVRVPLYSMPDPARIELDELGDWRARATRRKAEIARAREA